MSTLPVEHVVDGQLLHADGLADLFELRLTQNQGIIRVWNGNQITWGGFLWESIGCILKGDERTADEQQSRPSFTIINPDNVFSPYVLGGYLENSLFIRKRVLKAHLDSDVNIFQQRIWVVSRVANLQDQRITLELREPYEGPNSLIPARVFIPPEFPAVNIR